VTFLPAELAGELEHAARSSRLAAAAAASNRRRIVGLSGLAVGLKGYGPSGFARVGVGEITLSVREITLSRMTCQGAQR
jgi:hypothetical protein